jgi:hypothetical protein
VEKFKRLSETDKILHDNMTKVQRRWNIRELYSKTILYDRPLSDGLQQIYLTINSLIDGAKNKYAKLDHILFRRCLLLLPADTEGGRLLRDEAYKYLARRL